MQKRDHNPYHVNAIGISKFAVALFNFIEAKVLKHHNKIRKRNIDEVKFKLFKTPTLLEKVQYFDLQIEQLVRELTMQERNARYAREIKRIRRQTLKNSIIMLKRES